MSKKFRALLHLIIMSIALVAVVAFAVIHALTAMNTQYGTLIMIAYAILFIWAACRVVILIKEYRSL